METLFRVLIESVRHVIYMIAHWLTHFIIRSSDLIFPLKYQMSNSVNAWTLDVFLLKSFICIWQWLHEPLCPLCDHAYKTTEHFLFECPILKDLRQELLPPMPDIDNTLFGNLSQLINTSKYYFMANRRAKAHN